MAAWRVPSANDAGRFSQEFAESIEKIPPRSVFSVSSFENHNFAYFGNLHPLLCDLHSWLPSPMTGACRERHCHDFKGVAASGL